MNIQDYLEESFKSEASDLHLLSGYPPSLRVNGNLSPLLDQAVLTETKIEELIFSILNPEQKEQFLANKELDFSYNTVSARYRVNLYFAAGSMAAAFRLLPLKVRSIDELNLPKICHNFVNLRQGFILMTGPTGHGKSTTLAAIVNEINQTRPVHILTVEDPIEYVYPKGKAMISQREMHSDTHGWEIALRACLREDPDVVLVGEMRDYETIAAALTIAETGHLVFATLHTNSASQTIDRIVDVFPEESKAQVRMQLAGTLEAVVSQRLLPDLEGGRIPACEILLGTDAVRSTIREGKSHLIDNIIQTSADLGMISLERYLVRLVKLGKISASVAQEYALRPEELVKQLKDK